MTKKYYTFHDFVMDKKFREWIINPNKDLNCHWEKFISENPEKLNDIEQAKTILLNLSDFQFNISDEKIKDIWNQIERRTEQELDQAEPEKIIPLNSQAILSTYRSKKDKPGLAFSLFAAAIVFLVISSLTFFYVYLNAPVDTEGAGAENPLIVKSNPWGQKSTIFLNDGTEVVLNSGSSLRYHENFDEDERKVVLEGEAFFTVAKDAQRPFRVYSQNIMTEALGTSFNIKAFREENRIDIALVSGKVRVENQDHTDQKMILDPGESITYDSNTKEVRKGRFDPKSILSWRNGIIYFNNANEAEVIEKLERWYGVKFKVNNRSPKRWSFSGEFYNKSLENVLNSIGFTMDFDFTIDNKNVEINYN